MAVLKWTGRLVEGVLYIVIFIVLALVFVVGMAVTGGIDLADRLVRNHK